ncbi:hypothetical protein EV702DRAFT_452387 [Suillus placidus]|uniref:DUF6533 domain-containing protein n=1 Tax=Suillus placidus TaxID=48579 RepID=A0A9P6ZRM5_9AGAM|nr:hypothetical protein EV702DRAFT_452387 [Suillus placidus]
MVLISTIKALDISSTNAIVVSTKFAVPSHPSSNSMTQVSDDPTWWPAINVALIYSYFAVASSAGVIYDWALTFEQEVELVWRQRWSLMTVMYLSVRYLGILFAVINILFNVPTISMTDLVSLIVSITQNWINVIATAILCVIMIARLRAMHQGSRKVMIFLVVAFLAVNIVDCAFAVIVTSHMSGEELILSGTYQCNVTFGEQDTTLLESMSWILTTAWEVAALCLAVWIAVKHFRELQRHSSGGIIEDCFAVLMKSHVIYFASFVAVSCLELGYLSPAILTPLFVLGPRLILSVREYYAQVVADSDGATSMLSIVFQERVHVPTSGV